LEFLGDYAKDGYRVLDFGCGNGRLLELIGSKNIIYTGVDVSQKLINIAKGKYIEENVNFLKINPSQNSLPFKDNYFNAVYSVAVFHHIPSKELRLKIAKEVYRITKPGGYIIVTVWNLWQPNYIKNIFNNYIKKLTCRSKLDWNDCYITFKNNQGEVFSRYHHAYKKNDLQKLFIAAEFSIEICEIIQKRNIILIAKKE
jgi:ubiquinone/menaquinone biosynthesis C-methylase UbiE